MIILLNEKFCKWTNNIDFNKLLKKITLRRLVLNTTWITETTIPQPFILWPEQDCSQQKMPIMRTNNATDPLEIP